MEVQVAHNVETARSLLIAGEWIQGRSTTFTVLNKFDNRPLAEISTPTAEQVREAVQAAVRAFHDNRKLSPHERGRFLDKTAAALEARSDSLQRTICAEAGFTLSDAAGEVQRAIQTFRLAAEEARRFTGTLVPVEGAPGQVGRMCWTMRIPLGVVAAITPFNAPLNTVAHKVAPALAAGNAIILKPSPHTPLVACQLAEALMEAGTPKGLVSVLHGGAEVVQGLLDEQDVKFYAFTGSTEAGRAIQQRAGLRRTQMELGSIAFGIVCDDADLDFALPKIVNAAYRKAGQVCTSIQLLLVHKNIFPIVEARLTERVRDLAAGNPLDPATVVGPVISPASAQRISDWIDQAVQSGATCLAGGSRQGNVVAPTLLKDISPETPLGCQEVFGPVMSLVPFSTLDEAITQVNATPYGLATGIFTNRLDEAFRFITELQVGGVHINETSSSRVDMMPYGGSKASGFGREGPYYAMREMSEERVATLLSNTNRGKQR
ncbi:aldehyde dehydrogenase family protein [Castellaniella sp. S9]|uniref:aldehyde dehydrogenase family protein n=1 Tax=Castellaniella sp. S9 TaxID=2993652 RepID=UPI0022B4D7CE|nr:aldehyde dehydrogenase family protein [Castellaniella sp. S9]